MSGHLPAPAALLSKKEFSVLWGLFRIADLAWALRRPQQFLSHIENLKKSLVRAALSAVTILTELYQLLKPQYQLNVKPV